MVRNNLYSLSALNVSVCFPSWKSQIKRGKVCLRSGLQRSQSIVAWSHCFWSCVVWQTVHGRAEQLASWQLGKPENQKSQGQNVSSKSRIPEPVRWLSRLRRLPPKLDRHLRWIPQSTHRGGRKEPKPQHCLLISIQSNSIRMCPLTHTQTHIYIHTHAHKYIHIHT